MALLESYTGYGRKYLGLTNVRPVIRLGKNEQGGQNERIPPEHITAAMHAILCGLMESGTRSYAELARKINMPPVASIIRLSNSRVRAFSKGVYMPLRRDSSITNVIASCCFQRESRLASAMNWKHIAQVTSMSSH